MKPLNYNTYFMKESNIETFLVQMLIYSVIDQYVRRNSFTWNYKVSKTNKIQISREQELFSGERIFCPEQERI